MLNLSVLIHRLLRALQTCLQNCHFSLIFLTSSPCNLAQASSKLHNQHMAKAIWSGALFDNQTDSTHAAETNISTCTQKSSRKLADNARHDCSLQLLHHSKVNFQFSQNNTLGNECHNWLNLLGTTVEHDFKPKTFRELELAKCRK